VPRFGDAHWKPPCKLARPVRPRTGDRLSRRSVPRSGQRSGVFNVRLLKSSIYFTPSSTSLLHSSTLSFSGLIPRRHCAGEPFRLRSPQRGRHHPWGLARPHLRRSTNLWYVSPQGDGCKRVSQPHHAEVAGKDFLAAVVATISDGF